MKNTFLLLLVIATTQLFAQQPAKKALSVDDFAGWKTIENDRISNDGKYVVYELNPQKGDGNLVITNGNRYDTIPRGYRAAIGSESDFVVFHIKPPADSVRKAKLDKIKKDKMPKDSIGIFDLEKNDLQKYPKVKSYKLPEENAYWLAILLERRIAKNDSSDNGKKEKQHGDDLLLMEPHNGDTLWFSDVTEYAWSKKGLSLGFVGQTEDSTATYSTLSVFNTVSGEVSEVFSGKGWIKKPTFSDDGSQVAFLFSADTIDEKVYSLYHAVNGNAPVVAIDSTTRGLPSGWSPAENGNIHFSEDGTKLYLGTIKNPEPELKDSILDEEKPKLDIWNWKDLKLQPQQLVEAKKEKERTYLAVYHVAEKRFVQLADQKIRTVSTIKKGNGDVGLGYDEFPYQRSSSWTGKRNRDYYLVDFVTGIKRNIVNDKSYVRLSPTGKFVVWYDPADSSYYARSTDINDLEVVSLTKMIPVSFYNEWNDRPEDPRPHGIAGWSEEDRFVFIYDRYDLWRIDPTGEKVPVNMTKAYGRRNQIRLRYVKLDNDLEHIPLNDDILLNAFDERNMSSGYFKTRLNEVNDPQLLVMDNFMFRGPKKAKNAEKLLWTKQSVKQFPDLWCSNLEFRNAKKVSEANPQQADYKWPEVELVEWTSFSGKRLKGLLYTPGDLDHDGRYPMLVYFYERSSETLHRYMRPAPSRSVINISFYTSNGYVVFVPDIVYITGYPGQSAYNAIVSGTQHMVNNYPFVNPKKIGLQGQSWGGYQTAWLITQTDMYAAAMAGAPVSNMTSAYGGIRWATGMSRMWQYEHSQSRIGGTLWDKPLLYIENSPLFHAPKINTPLLMMHNDNDGAVPWYQGIEMFVALRRLDKPVWMLNYNGEPHNLSAKSWANRLDLSKRMFQFFNHYLMDKPAPEWMEKGVPATEKGKNLGY